MQFFIAILDYLKAISLINRLKLWGYVLIPGVVSLLLGILIVGLTWQYSSEIGGWMTSWYVWKGESIISRIGSFFSAFLILGMAFLLFKYIIIIVVGPLLTPISEKIEAYLNDTYQKKPFRMKDFTRSMSRGIRIALRNISRELFFTALLIVVSFFFPPIAPITAVLLLLIQAYYAGFGNMDYTLDRHRNYKASIQFVRRHRLTATGNGVIYVALLLTGVGFLIAPPIAAAAATISSIRALKK